MPAPPFDPSKAVTFDVSHGQVHLAHAPNRVLVPADALLALALQAGSAPTVAFARQVGEPLGEGVARRLGGSREATGETLAATLDEVIDQLGGELALVGLGALSLERWGKALVLVVDHSPLRTHGTGLLGDILTAALEAATGATLGCALLMQDETRVRFLVAREATLTRARTLLQGGVSWGEALARIHTL